MILKIKELVLFSILSAILVTSQIALSFLPNIELVTFFIIIFSIIYGKKIIYSILIFVIIEGFLYGFGPWWFGYLLIWPLLSIISIHIKGFLKDNFLKTSLFSGLFGFIFGALFAIPYVLIGDYTYALTFWLNGIPFDLLHMAGNYFLMLFIGEKMYKIILNLSNKYFNV